MKRKESKSSPKGGKKGCVCKDGTYDVKCCDGTLPAQGIGDITTENAGTVVNIVTVRQIN